jgi:uncharacterized membrane protein YcaP (DUF421 family)
MNWSQVFGLSTPPLEVVVRGTLMYLSIFFILRVVFKRESGGTGITDLLVVVLIADAAQNGMAGNYQSVPEGLLLVATIIFWSALLNALAFKFQPFRRLVRHRPLVLVRDGCLLRQNLAKELVTDGELFSQLREQGVTSLGEVRVARMEPDGKLSVTPYNPPKRRPAPVNRVRV